MTNQRLEVNAFWAMKPILIACNLAGLSYHFISLKKKKSIKMLDRIMYYLSFLYSAGLLCIQAWFCIYWMKLTEKYMWSPNLEMRIIFVVQMIYSTLCFVISFYSVATTKKLNELIRKIDRLDRRLKGIKHCCKDQYRKICSLILVFVVFSVIGQTMLFHIKKNDSLVKQVLKTILRTQRICIIPLTVMQFIGLVGLIRRRLVFINRLLSTFGDTCLDHKTCEVLNLKYFRPCKKFKNAVNTENSLENLHLIRIVYKDLVEISQMINQTFSFVLLCMVLTALILVSVVTFLVILEFSAPTSGSGRILHLAARGSCILAGCIVAIYDSAATTKELERSRTIIHSALRKKHSLDMRNELNEFIHQLLLVKIKFSAFKIFPMDQTLLYSINGTVTTGFIVLLQMKVSEVLYEKELMFENRSYNQTCALKG